MIVFSLTPLIFTALYKITLNFFSSNIFLDFNSLKNAVKGWIVNTSNVCTKYVSCDCSKYLAGVLKSVSIKIKEWFLSNVSKTLSTLFIPSPSSGSDVYTVNFLLTAIPFAIPFAKPSILWVAIFLKDSSFFV